MTLKTMGYRQWILKNPDLKTLCPDCKGHGDMPCGECGQSKICEDCQGSGDMGRVNYGRQKQADLDKAAKFEKSIP